MAKRPTPSKLITKEQAAELTGFSPEALHQKAIRREIPFYRVGRLIRFDPQELLESLAKNHVPAKELK